MSWLPPVGPARAPPPLPLPEPVAVQNIRERLVSTFNPKRVLNHFAMKALKSADVVLGSIPIAELASEIKDVVLIAIED